MPLGGLLVFDGRFGLGHSDHQLAIAKAGPHLVDLAGRGQSVRPEKNAIILSLHYLCCCFPECVEFSKILLVILPFGGIHRFFNEKFVKLRCCFPKYFELLNNMLLFGGIFIVPGKLSGDVFVAVVRGPLLDVPPLDLEKVVVEGGDFELLRPEVCRLDRHLKDVPLVLDADIGGVGVAEASSHDVRCLCPPGPQFVVETRQKAAVQPVEVVVPAPRRKD